MKDNLSYQKLNTRAEVLIAELALNKHELDITNIVIESIGGFNHVVRREISEISTSENDFGETTNKFKVVRKGLYDHLPTGLFHNNLQSDNADTENNVQPRIREIKRRKEIESESRRFFSPFDQLFNEYRLRLEFEERKVLTGISENSFNEFCDMLFDTVDSVFSKDQKSILFSLLPISHEIVGSAARIAQAFEAISGYPTEIRFETEVQAYFQNDNANSTYKLGDDFILGNSYEEEVEHVKIVVSNLPESKAMDFLPGQSAYALFEQLGTYFLPMEYDIQFLFEFEINLVNLELNESYNQASGRNRLGYTFRI